VVILALDSIKTLYLINPLLVFMILLDVLPVWFQWLSAIAGILSSVGVIIAFVQLKEASKQFKTQLKLTEKQFLLSNQGYVKMKMKETLILDDNEPAEKVKLPPSDNTLYKGLSTLAKLENVGNLPVRFNVIYFKVCFNGNEVCEIPQTMLGKTTNIIYPNAKQDFDLGELDFTDDGNPKSKYLHEIFDLHISCKLLIEYADYNNPAHKKTLNREFELVGLQPIWTSVKDAL
jgi:hypothetical protein